jgi:hypothetical protein
MHITWILSSKLARDTAGNLTSSMASTRYRVLQPAEHLAAAGHRIDLIQADALANAAELAEPLSADVVIVSKGLFQGSVALAERAKALGTQLLLDVCDDHFTTKFRQIYLALCRLADGVIASTPEMAKVIQQHTGRTATVISDPYEAPWTEVRFAPQSPVRLAWYGHPANFDTLAELAKEMPDFASRHLVDLSVVTSPSPSIAAFLRQWEQQLPGRLRTRFIPWTAEATWQTLREADAVVIPSLADSGKLVKSPNRLIESLRMGRFVAAYPLPAYQQFAEYAWLGERVLDGVSWALENRAQAIHQVCSGQEYVSHAFAPASIAADWAAALEPTARSVKKLLPTS